MKATQAALAPAGRLILTVGVIIMLYGGWGLRNYPMALAGMLVILLGLWALKADAYKPGRSVYFRHPYLTRAQQCIGVLAILTVLFIIVSSIGHFPR